MGLSLFRLGLVIAVAGIGLGAYVFAGAEKASESFVLDAAQTEYVEQYLESRDIGFFKTYSPDFMEGPVFVQIMDRGGNIVTDRTIETRMAVNYFDINQSGNFTVRATNLSDVPVYFEVEYGQTHAERLAYPGIMIFAGMMLAAVSSYRRLRRYIMAQPDENAW